jgi:predicted ArsR family transcriptional regulator
VTADDGEGGGDGHNTRTRTGRAELDQSILDFLKSQSEPVRALDIRKGIGGTAAQIRTRLNFLIEKGKVTYKGRASGTRYRAK